MREVPVGVRYIGNKSRIAEEIVALTGPPRNGRFIDGFSGSGSVAAVAANLGWPITVNDSLPSAVSMSIGATVGSGNVPFDRLGGYHKAVKQLNMTPAQPGFIHSEYSPASAATAPVERKYFTEYNAARLDAMRIQIEEWTRESALNALERELLLADLMQAANSVANISGTYGCFLKNWSPNALNEIELKARNLPDRTTDLRVRVGDVSTIQTSTEDTVYLDPPYTKRQYSAYYHILETIHAGDSPQVGGVTGLRPWKDKASDFCYKTKALQAILALVENTNVSRIFLSYSNEGHVGIDELTEGLKSIGTTKLHVIRSIGRYRPNSRASSGSSTVQEFVFEVTPH